MTTTRLLFNKVNYYGEDVFEKAVILFIDRHTGKIPVSFPDDIRSKNMVLAICNIAKKLKQQIPENELAAEVAEIIRGILE